MCSYFGMCYTCMDLIQLLLRKITHNKEGARNRPAPCSVRKCLILCAFQSLGSSSEEILSDAPDV